MDWWSVSVEARTDGAGQIPEPATDRFLDLTQPYRGSVGIGGEPPHWTATVSLEAAGAADAVAEAVRIVTTMAAEAGLPGWPMVRAEAVREDMLPDNLDA